MVCEIPRRPCVPMTMRSQGRVWAESRIESAGRPPRSRNSIATWECWWEDANSSSRFVQLSRTCSRVLIWPRVKSKPYDTGSKTCSNIREAFACCATTTAYSKASREQSEKSTGTRMRSNVTGLARTLSSSRSAESVRTDSTGQGAPRMTRSAVLPNKMCARPVLPLVPTTMRSESSARAAEITSSLGSPVATLVVTAMPRRLRTAFEVD